MRVMRKAGGNSTEEYVDDGRGVEGEDLADKQAADHRDAQWAAQFRADAGAKGQRDAGEERGQSGHEDGAEAKQRGFKNSFDWVFAVHPFGFEGEVDNHDAVFLHDTDEQDDADNGDDVE